MKEAGKAKRIFRPLVEDLPGCFMKERLESTLPGRGMSRRTRRAHSSSSEAKGPLPPAWQPYVRRTRRTLRSVSEPDTVAKEAACGERRERAHQGLDNRTTPKPTTDHMAAELRCTIGRDHFP